MFLESLSQQFHRCILKISGMKEFLWYFHSNETSLELQQLTQIFQLPHTVALEPYIRVFQYKVQLPLLSGAYVIGTTSTEEKAAKAKACGADEVILYSKKDFVQEVNSLTNGGGVNVVYDGVGKATFDKGKDDRKLYR